MCLYQVLEFAELLAFAKVMLKNSKTSEMPSRHKNTLQTMIFLKCCSKFLNQQLELHFDFSLNLLC